jgi:hypothetical protein
VLAYHFLRGAERPLTAAELDRRIEGWFARQWEAVLDFEIDDGVGKLRPAGAGRSGEQGWLTAVRLDDAKQRPDRIWENLFAHEASPSTEPR